jgi:hypothetical protein
MDEDLRNDDHRALCLSGSIPIAEYIKALDVGFGTIEIRGRRYRILDRKLPTDELIYIETSKFAQSKTLCQLTVHACSQENGYLLWERRLF